MKILEFYRLNENERTHWTDEMSKCDWDAGDFLVRMLKRDEFRKYCGKDAEVLLAAEGDRLAGFCTLAEHDEIPSDEMKPWIGFVYTFPDFRGRRCSGHLTEYAVGLAKKAGYESIYVSSEEKGFYEKYGFTFLKNEMSEHGYMTQIFVRKI